MKRKEEYAEDELVQLLQDGDITLQDFVEMHPYRWQEKFSAYCRRQGVVPSDASALDFIALKDSELEEAIRRGDL